MEVCVALYAVTHVNVMYCKHYCSVRGPGYAQARSSLGRCGVALNSAPSPWMEIID